LRVIAPLARPFVAVESGSGIGRRIVRPLFALVHQRLGYPARARMTAANGAEFTVDCANTAFLEYGQRINSSAGYEPEVSGLLKYLCPRLRTVFDVGANWGYYPLLLGTEPRFRGEVHAFEIRPGTAEDLRGVLAGAGLADRVSVHPFGLSDREGQVQLSRETHSYLVRIVSAASPRETESARVCRLDDLALPPPDLIKIDVEGHEASVLRGARRVLQETRPLVVFESWYNPSDPEGMLEPLRLLQGFGYQLHRLEWRPMPKGSGRQAEIDILPLTPAERGDVPRLLNLLAIDPDRVADFFPS
jgi:FkbM family methyltransferase